MKRSITIISLFVVLLSACTSHDCHEHANVNSNEHMLYATIYQQHAAEVRALQQQAFNIAEYRLNDFLKSYKGDKKLAVVVDVDETVLDNSPWESRSIIEETDYPTNWDEWCNKAVANPLPGAVEFLNYASSKGVETFYVTNRKIHLQEVTMKNLEAKGFPFVDDAHMMLRVDEGSKEPRRLKILEDYEIVLLMGDNLGDIHKIFDDKKNADRIAAVEQLKSEFGKKFIVLPNPMYGAWVDAMIANPQGMSKQEKLDALKSKLVNW